MPKPIGLGTWVTIIGGFGTEHQGWLKPSPSPEARVDWEKWSMEIVDGVKADGVIINDEMNRWSSLEKRITKALSAAFEKGREAR